MPEGPSIVILKEALSSFAKKEVVQVEGNAKIDLQRMRGLKISAFQSWGKNLIISFPGFFLKIHMMMFGTYRINERKDAVPRMRLTFRKGEINFYTCSIKIVEGTADEFYDWETDVMSDAWNPRKAKKSLLEIKKEMVCDALLNQEIFSGVGNIIKNEVLFRIRLHPETKLENLPVKKLNELIKDARLYSFDFYEWKKIFQLKKHWLIYKKKECLRCHLPVTRKYSGKTKRLTCFCSNCQILYKSK